MQINEIMGEKSPREEIEEVLNLMKKNLEAVPKKELAKGGRYHKAFRALQERGQSAMKKVIADEIYGGIPYTEEYFQIFEEEVCNTANMKVLSKAYYRLLDMQLCNMLIEELHQKFENIINSRFGTNYHFCTLTGINMPVEIIEE